MPTNLSLVSLQDITSETVRSVIDLSVSESQKGFVAPNAVSLAQALFQPEAWYKAIYYGEDLVGFVMLADESLCLPPPSHPKIEVWRFMIDVRYQRRGIGRAALLQVIEHVRRKYLFTSLQLSYVPGSGCAEQFYLELGFRHTGQMDGEEVVLEFLLEQNEAELDVISSSKS
jgi:diamine N-acetyltransferase